jgi:hypothetical protein
MEADNHTSPTNVPAPAANQWARLGTLAVTPSLGLSGQPRNTSALSR